MHAKPLNLINLTTESSRLMAYSNELIRICHKSCLLQPSSSQSYLQNPYVVNLSQLRERSQFSSLKPAILIPIKFIRRRVGEEFEAKSSSCLKDIFQVLEAGGAFSFLHKWRQNRHQGFQRSFDVGGARIVSSKAVLNVRILQKRCCGHAPVIQ